MRNAIFIIPLLFLVFSLSCNFREVKNNGDETSYTNPNNGEEQASLSFDEVFTLVFEPNCLLCHSASSGNLGGVNLETYDEIKKNLGRIKTSTIDERRMPPGSGLPAEEFQALANWIEAGANR